MYNAGSGANNGWCDPQGFFDWGVQNDCWTYDGNKTGCNYAKDTLGWTCSWMSDTWGPLVTGETEAGWCDMMFGGVGGGASCWDFFDENSCNSSDWGCNWKTAGSTGTAAGWCNKQGCWNYYDQTTCDSNANKGCKWDSTGGYCYEIGCWDLNINTTCLNASSFGLNCTWNINIFSPNGGWCEESENCYSRDYTNQTYCESKTGCFWTAGSKLCDPQSCWQFDSNGQTDCENTTLTGLDCLWETSDANAGWCEQPGCWDYDNTNESVCVNTTADLGLSCGWDNSNQICYEDFNGCSDNDGNQFGCMNTGWCIWEPSGNGTCTEPVWDITAFFNPGCWIFDQAGQGTCGNISTCLWGAGVCGDSGADANNGVQCQDINNSEMCNKIPMLSSCCKWNGSSCTTAPFSTSCWDSMQAPPEGANFCDDYNAIHTENTCNQIAADPWYMPCKWNSSQGECLFEFDNLFGGDATGFDFMDISSKQNCESMKGQWISETWVDGSGFTHTDSWCEMNFGFTQQSCSESCWACEQNDNGTAHVDTPAARSACEQSAAGCVFYADSNAFNTFGWCDMDFGKVGNCDNNCWDCWNQNTCDGDDKSLAGCIWFTDPYNDFGWCDDQNIKTCDDECYNCWDQLNCQNSDAGCTWDINNWFCTQSGTGTGGESIEICFDGIDNDADTFVDCDDTGCMFDSFCGGSKVLGSNCLSIAVESGCTSEGCTWIVDNYNNSWCDINGSQCWLYDDDNNSCVNQTGCGWKTMDDFGNSGQDFCDINYTWMDTGSCWNNNNQSSCNAANASGCTWTADPWCAENPTDAWCLVNNDTSTVGWCDNTLWSCWQYDDNQTACGEQSHCGWVVDWFDSSMGFCDPVCFSRNSSTCGNNVTISGTDVFGVCQSFNSTEMGWCEPTNTFKGCWDNDDNQTACTLANATCSWVVDPHITTGDGGFCADKFIVDMMGNMDPSPPLVLEVDPNLCVTGANQQSDICGFGLKDDPSNLGLGIEVAGMNNSAICRDKFNSDSSFAASTNETIKFYWYLDTNGNQSGGCNATDNISLGGFDFKFKYESGLVSGALVETKVAYKCSNGQWSPSKIKLIPWHNMMCYEIGGGVVSVAKEDLEKLAALGLYDDTQDFRIYATTALANGSDNSTYETIGPVWYTPNSADFKFEDCTGLVDADGDGLDPNDDPDCIDFLKLGYIDLEIGSKCSDDIDNDGNGLKDCLDPACMYDLAYCSAIDSENDTSAPTITWLEVDAFKEGAFIGVDTNEPTNATLFFYGNDSRCSTINQTILDEKLNNTFTDDDYDMWHDFPTDQFYFDSKGLVFTFESNTTYYYKLKLCDQNSNCALSACSSFTTTTTTTNFTVGFELPAPGSDVTELLGNINVDFDYDGDGITDDDITGGDGIRLNDTQGRDVDIKFQNPNATDHWEIEFIGSDLLGAQTLNITDAFIVNTSSDGNNDTLIGMDSDKWNEMVQKLGVDQIKIIFPQGFANGSNITFTHCPDNATTLSAPGCVNYTTNATDGVNCTFNTTSTTCYIPTSIGFSVGGVQDGSGGDSTPSDDSSPSDGGGGDGSSTTATPITLTGTTATYTVGRNEEYSFSSGSGALYTLKITKVSSSTLEFTLNTVATTISLGQETTLTLDGNEQMSIKLVSITDRKGDIELRIVSKKIVSSVSLVSSLNPTTAELQDVGEQILNDNLVREKLQEYLGPIDFEASKAATKIAVENIYLSKSVTDIGNGQTRVDIIFKNTGSSQLKDIVLIEAIPKSIIENIAEIKSPTPNYDIIIKEDPIIQWRFKEFDTAIVAWTLGTVEPGAGIEISYVIDSSFSASDHISSIIVQVERTTEETSEPATTSSTSTTQISAEPKKVTAKTWAIFTITLVALVAVLVYVKKHD